jgi:hypothetical protein
MGRVSTGDPTVIDIQPELAQRLGTDLQQQALTLSAKFRGLAITDTQSCQQAVLDRQEIGERVKVVERFFEPFKSMAHKLHRALCDREKEILGPLMIADTELRTTIQTFTADQDRMRRQEEARLADERRREDEARQLAEAALLEQAGEAALAAAVIEQAVAAPIPVVTLPNVRQQVEGLKTRRVWKWRYIGNDRTRAMSLIPREYLMPDETKIGRYVQAMKESSAVPGIQVFSEDVPVR